MSRPLAPAPGRSLASVVIAAFAAAILMVPVAQPTDAAVPLCMGQKATLVGTAGDDTLNGTAGVDVIVGLGARDRINGRGGNDLICGGGGADRLDGGAGRDRIKGGAGPDTIEGGGANDRLVGSGGNDTIHGNTGNDAIDGSRGTDACFQDAGTGTVRNCETASPDPGPDPGPGPGPDPGPGPGPGPGPKPDRADLSVTVSAPKKPTSGAIPFTVRVRNNGPDDVKYTLTLALESRRATCAPVDWVGSRSQPALKAGKADSLIVTATCQKTGGGAKASVTATVDAKGVDPVSTNDSSIGQARVS